MVLNHDLAQTIADLTGAKTPQPTADPLTNHAVDGQSLYDYLTFGPTWSMQNIWQRSRFGVEHWRVAGTPTDDLDSTGGDFYCEFHGIWTGATGGNPDPANVLYFHNTSAPCTSQANPYEYYPSTEPLEKTNQCYPNNLSFNCPDHGTSSVDPDLQAFSDEFENCNATGLETSTGPALPTCQAIENATANPLPAYVGLYPPVGRVSLSSFSVHVVASGLSSSSSYSLWYYPVSGSAVSLVSSFSPNTYGVYTTDVTINTGSTTGIGAFKVKLGTSISGLGVFGVTP